MKIIKIYIAVFGIAFITGCTLDANRTDGITKADLETASQILGESLSSDNSGVMLSLRDALTNFSTNSFIPDAGSTQKNTDRSGRGSETGYGYAYHPETGIHGISFQRHVQKPLFDKEVSDTLNYIFKDKSGNFVEFPGQKRDYIASIIYNARKEGTISTLKKESFFIRKDTLLIGGLSDASPTLSIDGVHNGKGVIKLELKNKTIERFYELEINFLNIKIDKTFAGSSFHRGVTGTLSWRMVFKKNSGNPSDSKIMQGTIKLSGDGTALLNFHSSFKRFQVNINNGEVNDLEKEFEGAVQTVNDSNQSITLVNGKTVYITSDTEFDSESFPDFESVQSALNNGIYIWTEGEGFTQNGRFIVTEIEFENRSNENDEGDDDDGEGEIEFESFLTAADAEAGTFILDGQVIVGINDQTIIENSSEYQSIQEVAEAIENGISINAKGEARQADKNSGLDLIATSVDFDKEEDDDENNE